MAKSRSKISSSKDSAKVPAAFADKKSAGPAMDKDNPSKFQPTSEADLSSRLLDPADGLVKLFSDSIKDLYWAENHLVKALPKMEKAASSKALKTAISKHLEQTKTHVARLEQVFELLSVKKEAKKCDAMEGLTKEGEGVVETTDKDTDARDLGIIMASQKVEHYEISAYTGLVKLADKLDLGEISAVLSETLGEEEDADAVLAEIADNGLGLNKK
jgi:ferritin-like metal-binding protein YciE